MRPVDFENPARTLVPFFVTSKILDDFECELTSFARSFFVFENFYQEVELIICSFFDKKRLKFNKKKPYVFGNLAVLQVF